MVREDQNTYTAKIQHTKMEEYIGLVVLEHLGNQLNVHVLDVDLLVGVGSTSATTHVFTYLKTLIHDHDCFIELLLRNFSVSISLKIGLSAQYL